MAIMEVDCGGCGALLATALLTIVVYLMMIFIRDRKYWRRIREFNGGGGLPLLGNAMLFTEDSEEILKALENMWRKNGMTNFRIHIAGYVFIHTSEPDTFEALLGSNKEIVKMPDYNYFVPWLGDGLLQSKGAKWRTRRKMITPTFHFNILEKFLPMINDKGNILVEKLTKLVDTGAVDVYPYITLYTLDVICETAMGTDLYVQDNADSKYVKAVYQISELIHHRAFTFWKRIDFLYRLTSDYRTQMKTLETLHGMTDRVISDRRLQLKDAEVKVEKEDIYGAKQRTAFLDMLLLAKTPQGESLSDEDVREEVNTFMFEGHDTTSSCIGFALYSIANEPKVQALIYEEQQRIFNDDPDRAPTHADIQSMSYLDRVIKETLRLYPPVPFFGRVLIDDLPLPDGKVLPAGASTAIGAYYLGRNPKYFPDPLKFDPDRYLPEKTKDMHPYLNVAFSAGPRNCIGQKFAMLEIKSTLSKVVRRFELQSAGPEHSPRLMAALILKSKNGIHIKLKDRKTSL